MTKTKLVVSGPEETKEVSLDPKGVTLGREESCGVVLNHPNVSRVHARISHDPFGRWIVEDLGSQNGVMVEGQRIKAQAILPDQKIDIRPFTISLVQESDQQMVEGSSIHTTLPVVDKGPGGRHRIV
jgi:pSer/pThr/pTyr-binding forkhead associated (FHA) protein